MALERGRSRGSDLQELAQLLSQAERHFRREIERVLDGQGSTIEQWRTLALLMDGASHTMTEITEHTLLPAASSTRVIDRMVAQNLVYRRIDPADRRRVLVRATSRGQELHHELRQRIEAERDTILAETDSDEVAQLTALLGALLDRWS
jgi:DNA-binding MarR family transcriptional regulator